LRNHRVVHIGCRVAQLHFDHLDGFIDALANAARP
jgi:hypothetical protein